MQNVNNEIAEHPIIFSPEMVKAILGGGGAAGVPEGGRKTQTRRIIKPQPERINNIWNWTSKRKDRLGSAWEDSFDPSNLAIAQECCPYGKGRDSPGSSDLPKRSGGESAGGDLLWVREKWRIVGWNEDGGFWIQYGDGFKDYYEPDEDEVNEEQYCRYLEQITIDCQKAGLTTGEDGCYRLEGGLPTRWRSSRFMPKWAARIWLEITRVRVERLQEISVEDCKAEGITIPANGDKILLRLTGDYPLTDYWPEGTMSKGEMPPKILKPDEFIKAHYFSLWDSLNAKRCPLDAYKSNPWVWVIEFKRVAGDKVSK